MNGQDVIQASGLSIMESGEFIREGIFHTIVYGHSAGPHVGAFVGLVKVKVYEIFYDENL